MIYSHTRKPRLPLTTTVLTVASLLFLHCGLLVGNGSYSIGSADGGLGDTGFDGSALGDGSTGVLDAGLCTFITTLPLDALDGSTAAYGLRPLRAAYTGPLATLVRGGTGGTVTMTVVADAGVFPTAEVASWAQDAGITVSKWFDQSGNYNDIVQTTSTRQPTLSLSAINSYPGITFLSSAQQSLGSSLTWITGNEPWTTVTTILGGLTPQAGSYQPLISYGDVTQGTWRSFNVDVDLGGSFYYGLSAYGSTVIGLVPSTVTPAAFALSYSSTNAYTGGQVGGAVNGVPIYTAADGGTVSSSLNYGPLQITGTEFYVGGAPPQYVWMTGTLGTVIVFPFALSAAQMSTLQQMEQCYYGPELFK